MPSDIPWEKYLPRPLIPVSFVNSELAADPKGMVKKWKAGQGCDLVLFADDIKMMPCHRNVLENLGGNVPEILLSNQDPLNCREVKIRHMDVAFVSTLISYAYTGKVELTTETVLGILDGSFKCQIAFLQDRCVDFLVDNISQIDHLLLLNLADEKGWLKLRSEMLRYGVTRFSDIIEEPGFLQLTPGVLLEMLRSERLLVGSPDNMSPPSVQEKKIWQAVKRYTDFNPEERVDYLIGFLQHIRLPLMNRDDLLELEKSLNNSGDDNVKFLVAKAKKVKATIRTPVQDEESLIWKRPRTVTPLRVMQGVGFADRNFSLVRSYPEETFDDLFCDPWVHVTALKLTFRTWEKSKFILSSIKVSYSNGQSRLHGTEYSSVYELTLDPEERIVKVEGGAGCMIDRLQFTTNKGRVHGPFGGKGGKPVEDAPPPECLYCHLAGISGTAVETEGGYSVRRLKCKWSFYQE